MAIEAGPWVISRWGPVDRPALLYIHTDGFPVFDIEWLRWDSDEAAFV